MTRIGAFLIGVVLVSGCVAPQPEKMPSRIGVDIRPDNAGLRVDPVGKRIDFGRSPKGVVPVLDRELGRHVALPLTGCAPEIRQQLRWGNLVLTFTKERFVGWRSGGTASGKTCTATG